MKPAYSSPALRRRRRENLAVLAGLGLLACGVGARLVLSRERPARDGLPPPRYFLEDRAAPRWLRGVEEAH